MAKLSIQNQLIALIAILLIFVELSTLVLVTWFDRQERRTTAVEQAITLGRSMNNDLLKALISPDADIYADAAENEVKSLFDGYNEMISQVKKTTDLLHYHSRHDSLTGLYNHYALEQELLSVLKMTDNNCIQHALLSIDLDQFKLINDSIGHTAGDELLKMFSHHLKHDIPANMVLARVGAMTFFY